MKKIMRRFLMVGLLVVGGAFPALVSAATVHLSGAPSSVSRGNVFEVNVLVDPQGASVYTAKIGLNFPSDILSVRGFSFAGNALPLAQSGYDVTDNVGGLLIKTAGFPGGVNSEKLFGVVTFYAKSSGTATITVNAGSSLILDKTNGNVYSGSSDGGVAVTVVAPAVAQENGGAEQLKSSQTASAPVVAKSKSGIAPRGSAQLAPASMPASRLSVALLALAYVLYPFSNVVVLLLFVAALFVWVAVLYRDRKSIGHKKVSYVAREHIVKKIKNKTH